MAISRRKYLETGSEKFKMAAAKTGCTSISASVQDSKEILTAICMFFVSGNSKLLSKRLNIGTGSQKIKMAPAKPEVPVFQLLYKIAKILQKLTPCFRGRETQWRY
jgi:hypothetical protein